MRIIQELTSFEPLESKEQIPFVWSESTYVWKMGWITYHFELPQAEDKVSMTFLVIDEPVNGPETVDFLVDEEADDIVPNLAVFHRGKLLNGFDAKICLTEENMAKIFGSWYRRHPTQFNPLGVSYEDFLSRFTRPSQATTSDVENPNPEPDEEKPWDNKILPDAVRYFEAAFLESFLYPPKFQPHTQSRLNYDNGKNFDIEAGIFSELPRGIDLTTVEILTFFPGYLKDPFFQYRCLSAGWTASSLKLAHNQHYVRDTRLSRKTISDTLLRTITTLTRDWTFTMEDYYKQPVHERSKVTDYTAGGFAMIAARDRDLFKPTRVIANPTLSRLLSLKKTLPSGNDAGTLTLLVKALEDGVGEDVTMLEVAQFVTNNPQLAMHHDADMDAQCAARYAAECSKNGRRPACNNPE